MVGALEYAMQSNLRMSATDRRTLLDTYVSLRPGENGIVTKEEAAVVLANVLRNELIDNAQNPYHDFRRSQYGLSLQSRLLECLAELKSDKAIPMLLSLVGGERIRSFDSQGHPAVVQYGDVLREFTYGRDGKLATFTETPPAKTYRREGTTNDFKADDGSKIKDVSIITQNSFMHPDAKDRAYRSLTDRLLNGEIGDFRYTKNGITHVVKPGGTILTEEVTASKRNITVTYPDGTSSRNFEYTKGGGETTCVVTTIPGDVRQTWKAKGDFGLWQSSDGIASVGNNRDGFIQPFDFDQAHYVYVKNGKQYFTDGNGREVETSGDGRTVTLKEGSLPADAHPDAHIRRQAALALCHLRESTTLPHQAAVDEIAYIRKRQEREPSYSLAFGPKAETSALADGMAKALANSSSDARAVVTTLYKGFLSKPLTADDPRLIVLRAALKDGNDLVRMAAAKMLMTSTAAGDKEKALFASADLSKNSGVVGLREESTKFINDQKSTKAALVTRALAETPDNPRKPAQHAGMSFDIALTRDVRFQRAFEQVKRIMIEGQPQYLRWTSRDWENYANTTKGYGLLSRSGFINAAAREEALMEENRGRLSKLFDSADTERKMRQEAKDSVIPKVWRAFDQLIKDAMEKKKQRSTRTVRTSSAGIHCSKPRSRHA
jgi:hypothetical protein